MNVLYESTLYLSITALIILVFKAVFKNKLSPRQNFLIWALLFIRLLFPILPESGLSLYNHIPSPPQIVNELPQIEVNTVPSSEALLPAPSTGSPASVAEQNTQSPINASNIIFAVWLIGALTLFLTFAFSYIRFSVQSEKSSEITNAQTAQILENCKNRLKIHKRVRIINGETPMLKGILRPVIILPNGYSKSETENIFFHELCHLKHNDILLIWIFTVILCLNWFNPIIWLSFLTFKRDIELYCDYRVLKLTSSKSGYAALLLKTALCKNRFVLGTTSLQSGEKEISARIKKIALFKKPKFIWSVALFLVLAAAAALCLTNAQKSYEMPSEELSEYCSEQIGSIMAEIDYASSEKVVFHYLKGLFVYDINKKDITLAFDLSKLNTAPHQQGSNGLDVKVSQDGKTALLTNYGPEDEIKDFKNYLINLESGKARQTDKAVLTAPFSGLLETQNVYPNASGWFSSLCAQADGKIYYLTAKNAFIGYMELITISSSEKKELSSTKVFEKHFKGLPEFSPSDIFNLTSAELEINQNYSNVQTNEDLLWLENTLKNAVLADESSCPFESTLYLTRKDGVTGVIHPSTDSCNRFISGGFCYTYGSESDNSEFLSKFGINSQDLSPSALYSRTKEYLESELKQLYSPQESAYDFSIKKWKENGNEATFFCTFQRPNSGEGQSASDNGENAEPIAENSDTYKIYIYELKAVIGGDPSNPLSSKGIITLYQNSAKSGEQWVKTTVRTLINGK